MNEKGNIMEDIDWSKHVDAQIDGSVRTGKQCIGDSGALISNWLRNHAFPRFADRVDVLIECDTEAHERGDEYYPEATSDLIAEATDGRYAAGWFEGWFYIATAEWWQHMVPGAVEDY